MASKVSKNGEYIMNFDDEEEVVNHTNTTSHQQPLSHDFLGRIMAGSTSSTEGVVSPCKATDFNQNKHYKQNMSMLHHHPQIPSGLEFEGKIRRKPTNIGPLMTLAQQQQAQRELWELFGKPNDWSLAKFYLIQQLQAFLIEIFRRFVTPDRPCLREAEMFAFVKQHIQRLIRRNGTMYTLQDDMEKTITGTLYGSKLFDKDVMMGTWTINAEKALVWENAMLERIEAKKPWQHRSTIDVANPKTGQITNQLIPANNMNFLNKTPVYNHVPSKAKESLKIETNVTNNHQAMIKGAKNPPQLEQLNQGVHPVLPMEKELRQLMKTEIETHDKMQHTVGLLEPNQQPSQSLSTLPTGGNESAVQPTSTIMPGSPAFPDLPQEPKKLPNVLKTPTKPTASQKSQAVLGKRPHREIIDDFESIYTTYKRQKRAQGQQQQQQTPSKPDDQGLTAPKQLMLKLEQLCKDETSNVDLGTMLKEFGSERLIGMLHAFVLLKPLLSKSLRDKEEQIVKETDLAKFEKGIKDGDRHVALKLDADEMQDRMDELHENMDNCCDSFNRTLHALQRHIKVQQAEIDQMRDKNNKDSEKEDQVANNESSQNQPQPVKDHNDQQLQKETQPQIMVNQSAAAQ